MRLNIRLLLAVPLVVLAISCCNLVWGAVDGDIVSWRYAGIEKDSEGAKIITKNVDEVVKKWDAAMGAHMVKFPMRKGEEWGQESSIKRTDHGYCYYVKDVKDKDLSYIKGVSKGMRKVYTVRYATVGDHEETDYAECVGIVRYEYVHHGTVDEKYLKLVEVGRK